MPQQSALPSAQSAVRIAKPGEPVVGTVIKQEYDWFDKYNLSVSDIAAKLNLTVPKTRAYMFEINVWDDPDMFAEKKVKSILFKRYTKKALDALREVKKDISVDNIWERQKMAVLGKKH